ncbi:AsmA family protein [Maribacter hydrothermalis]|uniref:DUF748 domain-containing protein n=1 Tax=Maribacter hydrothermalis TaxID=1836467 RepID=A0A1B7Z1B2_9FLAO|nr:hypothetical protein [Maribacter hydrothermalis]APQ18156.1 hypothetical protein BTR34_12845 [Maribacter hydrothermalis]OBR36503.1 hypothetical protein A9200_08735 [Maribacter hydrothermalis]
MNILNKKRKKYLLVFIGLVLFIFVAFSFIQSYIETRIDNFLSSELPKNIDFKYTDLEFSFLNSSLTLSTISAKNYQESKTVILNIDRLGVLGFNYWQFLINKKIKIDSIVLEKPDLDYNIDESYVKTKLKNDTSLSSFDKEVLIEEILINNGSLLLKKSDSTQFSINNFNFLLENVQLDSISIQNKIPFKYEDYKIASQDIYVNLGLYEAMTIDSLTIAKNVLELKQLTMNSKYSRKELSTVIEKERDHVSLNIEHILFNQIDFGFEEERFIFNASSSKIDYPIAAIYRDKLVNDDLTEKALYSKILRELPIAISISEIEIANGQLTYEELVNIDTKAGLLFFDEIDAKIKNLSNYVVENMETTIEASALFMQDSRMTLNWSFDVNNTDDSFLASGTFENFDAQTLNQFLESNANLRAKGHVDKLFFTVSGNPFNSKGDMRMKYENFELLILKNNRLVINKFLTTIGNIFIKKDSKTDEQGYRYGKIEVERDVTKSFFNYLWLNVRSGIGNTLTGNGKKE